MSRSFHLCLVSLLAAGCSGEAPLHDAAVLDSAVVDAPHDASAACLARAEALAGELYAAIGSCAVTVRLDYQTHELLGHQVFCGPYQFADESAARAAAQAATGHGDSGVRLGSADPEDLFVFWEDPGDFGGVGAVSVRTGLAVFGGSIVWDGAGNISYPEGWRDPAELGRDCPPVGSGFPARGWELERGTQLSAEAVDDVLAVVAQTALPRAFYHGGYVFDAVVLLYPRAVGVFDPGEAEWIVVVNGGWLE